MLKYLTTTTIKKAKETISLGANFNTYEADVSDSTNTITFRCFSADADGSGTLTLQYSNDRLSWETVTDDAGADITWTIDGTDTDGVDIKNPAVGWYRLNYVAGTNTEGTIYITVQR